MDFFGFMGDKIKNMGKSISNRFDDKFKSVFRILIASLGQFGTLEIKKTSIYSYVACV